MVYEAGKTHARASAPGHAYYAQVKDRTDGKLAAISQARKNGPAVRQSTLKQVISNTESAIRQYDLRGRAIARLDRRPDHRHRHRPGPLRRPGR